MTQRHLSDETPLTIGLVDIEPAVETHNGREPQRAAGGGKGSALWLGLGLLLLVAGALAVVVVMRNRRLHAETSEIAVRTADVGRGHIVQTVAVTASAPVRHIDLMGEARPFATVTLYAKVSGYLKYIGVDVGDRVTAGQVLATIESPETDRALQGAQADYENKAAIAKRVAQLLDRKFVSPQEADEAKAQASVAEQRVAALKEEQAYETLRAPFAGRVTSRFADPGALMQNAASSQTSALPVVTVSETDSLRILTYVDQADAAFVHPGDRVAISMNERPGLAIAGTVTRQSGEIDPKTRKMLVEVDVSDRSGVVLPGSFVQLRLDVPVAGGLQAPVEALTVRDGQTFVVVVGVDSTVHFRPVTLAGNDGKTVVFESGVSLHDRLAINIGDGIAEGAKVQVSAAPLAIKAPGGG